MFRRLDEADLRLAATKLVFTPPCFKVPSCTGISHSIAIQNQVATLMAIAIQTSRNNSKRAAHQLLQGSLRYPFSFGPTNFPKPKHRNYFVKLIGTVQDRQIAGEDYWTIVAQSMRQCCKSCPNTETLCEISTTAKSSIVKLCKPLL
jgi:hypothetical protein